MQVRLEPWSEDDLPIARRFLGDPRMMTHLGGVQTEEQIVDANARWSRAAEDRGGGMFKIVAGSDVVGNVGFWQKEWRDEPIYETGWSVFPEFQGHGYALQATRAIVEKARAAGDRRELHSFPHIGNDASNAICEKIGFRLLGPVEFEYPPGNFELSNDWVLDL